METEIEYRLPVSCISVTGSKTTRVDKTLGNREEIDRIGVATLKVIADPTRRRILNLKPDFGREATAAFKLSPDGRLASADVTVTGVGGTILTGVVGAAASLAGLALQVGVPLDDAGSDDEKIQKAYLAQHPAPATVRNELRAKSAALQEAHRKAVRAFQPDASPDDRRGRLREIAEIEAAQAALKQDLDRAELHFEAWRRAQVETSVVSVTYELTLDEIILADALITKARKLDFPKTKFGRPLRPQVERARAKVQAIWDDLGCLVLIPGDPNEPEVVFGTVPAQNEERSIFYRYPRVATLEFYKRVKDEAVVENIIPALVVDSRCPLNSIDVESGFFSKNRGAISFSPDGLPIGFDFGLGSDSAGFATAIGGVSATVASSLESAKKIGDQVSALRGAGLASELARVKAQVELKQQEILRDGLNARPEVYAELERLRVDAEIKEKEQITAEPQADPLARQIAELKQQVELLRLQAQLERLT